MQVEANRTRNNKILAIEDDPEVLALYKTYLQKRGYEVLSAVGAVEGMSLLQRLTLKSFGPRFKAQ